MGPPDQNGSTVPANEEIARSLGSLWQRLSGARAESTSIEIDRDSVRCVIEEHSPDPEGDAENGAVTSGSRRFQRDASAIVGRATGRRVLAFIAKRDEETRTSRQTFILEQRRQRS